MIDEHPLRANLLLNLLSNAIKFYAIEGGVELRVNTPPTKTGIH